MPLDPALRDRILASVEAGFAEQVAFTQEMIRFGSVRGEEHTVQDFVFRALKGRGFTMDRFAMDREAIAAHPGGAPFSDTHSEAPIVVGIHHPREEKGRSLILQAHVDVVPTGPDAFWAHRPFDPVIEGDWLYGRGGADMKAGHAANLFCLDALRRIGLQPAATVYVQSVVEEESTGNGALMTHLRGYKADAVLIPEPEEEMLVRANTGVLWFQIEVRGVPMHVREMGAGANASDGASSVPCWCRIDCRIGLYPGVSAEELAKRIEARVLTHARGDSFLANNPPSVTFNGFYSEGYVLEPGSEAEAVLGREDQGATGKPLKSFMT